MMQITTMGMPLSAMDDPLSANNYKYTGAYHDNTLNVVYFVDMPNKVVFSLYNATRFLSTEIQGIEVLNTQSGISDSTLLKMLAIVQKPELAKDLI